MNEKIKPPGTQNPPEKKRPRLRTQVGYAAALQQRVAAGEATPTEAEEYRRILSEFRRRYNNGQLSRASARQFGIN
jgi:hypothetical protein